MSAGDMAAADYVPNLVAEVLAWQINVGTQKIPNHHSKDTAEAKLGTRFAKLLLRRGKALGGKPSGRQLEPTEVALVDSVPGVPARGCSVHGVRADEHAQLGEMEDIPDPGQFPLLLRPPARATPCDFVGSSALDGPSSSSGREGQRVSTGKRSTPASQGSAASVAVPKTGKRAKVPTVSLLEGLFFDPQQGAWCGMHALNNYCLNGRLVQEDDCRNAARLVVQKLSDVRAGAAEPISNHLDIYTGWLSIDVINVLGQANLGLHVEANSVSWPDGLRHQQDGAALVNWNNKHWTVLQRDPSGDGWMHTNSVEGVALRYGPKRRLSDEAVQAVLDDISRDAGSRALHAITRAVGS